MKDVQSEQIEYLLRNCCVRGSGVWGVLAELSDRSLVAAFETFGR